MTDILAAWEEITPRGRLRRSAWEGTARRFEWGCKMVGDERPSVETLYVGQAMANAVLFKLMLSIAVSLVHTTPHEREAESADLLRDTLGKFAEAAEFDPDVAGLEPGTYDPDIAKQMALDALDEALTTLRTRVLGMKE